jgi:hypothetical protein
LKRRLLFFFGQVGQFGDFLQRPIDFETHGATSFSGEGIVSVPRI